MLISFCGGARGGASRFTWISATSSFHMTTSRENRQQELSSDPPHPASPPTDDLAGQDPESWVDHLSTTGPDLGTRDQAPACLGAALTAPERSSAAPPSGPLPATSLVTTRSRGCSSPATGSAARAATATRYSGPSRVVGVAGGLYVCHCVSRRRHPAHAWPATASRLQAGSHQWDWEPDSGYPADTPRSQTDVFASGAPWDRRHWTLPHQRSKPTDQQVQVQHRRTATSALSAEATIVRRRPARRESGPVGGRAAPCKQVVAVSVSVSVAPVRGRSRRWSTPGRSRKSL